MNNLGLTKATFKSFSLFSGLTITVASVLLDFFTGRPFGIGYAQGAGLAMGLLLILLAIRPRWGALALLVLARFTYFLSLLFFAVGAGLLLINLIGLPISMRNNKMYTEPVRYGGKERLALYTPEEVYSQMYRVAGERVQDYLMRVTTLVHEGTIHYWLPEGMNEYNLRVPIYENWILWLNHFGEIYLFCGTERAIERGATVCVQSTVILLGLMRRQGIDAQQYALMGHTVALVEVDQENDVWWFADADYGAVIPMDYRVVEAQPEKILPYYKSAGYADEPRLLTNLVNYYGKQGNHAQGGIDDFKYCVREENAYRLKWFLPLAAIIQFAVLVKPIQWVIQRKTTLPGKR
jgi:hypothetical protein